MVIGFVLITTSPGKEQDVYTTLKDVPEITEIYPVFGDYDIIAKIEVKDVSMLGTILINKIRSISGVTDTKTLTTGIEL
jgi:DNA-binding Lrp family transcriptional regulator